MKTPNTPFPLSHFSSDKINLDSNMSLDISTTPVLDTYPTSSMESCPTEVSDTMKVKSSIHKSSFSNMSKEQNSSLDKAREISEILDSCNYQVSNLRKHHRFPPRLHVT